MGGFELCKRQEVFLEIGDNDCSINCQSYPGTSLKWYNSQRLKTLECPFMQRIQP